MMKVMKSLLLILLLSIPLRTLSQVKYSTGIEYRLLLTSQEKFYLNDDGKMMDRSRYAGNRFKASVRLDFPNKLSLHGELYLLEGLNFGDELSYGKDYWNDIRDERNPFYTSLREFFIKWESPLGVVEAGSMLSHWGLGILANDGNGKSNIWGNTYYGDAVERIVFATKPFAKSSISFLKDRFITGLGADLVLRDENGGLLDGDIPFEAILFLLLQEKNFYSIGTYIAYRYQKFDEGDTLSVGAYDIYGKIKFNLIGSLSLKIQGEVALLEGKTDFLRSLNAPEAVHLLGIGGVLRTELYSSSPDISFIVEGGGASGDANLFDRHARIFTFDPDYNAGLIAYEEVMAGLTAGSAERISNPEILGVPPPGIEALATGGGISNSYYLNASLVWEPVKHSTLKAGFLDVWLVAPLIDPYLSTENGGVDVNSFGTINPRKHFGYEFDGSAEYSFLLSNQFKLKLAVEGGMFFKGSALSSSGSFSFPENIYKVQLKLFLEWKGGKDEGH